MKQASQGCGRSENDEPRQMQFSLAQAAVFSLLVFAVCDATALASHLPLGAVPAALGFVLMASAALAVPSACALHVMLLLGRRIPTAAMRALGAAVAAWYPSRWLSEVITSGPGISRSSWGLVVQIALLAALLISAATFALVVPIARRWVSRRNRGVVSLVLVGAGLGALWITNMHSTTYVRAYRGVLVVSTLMLQLGIIVAPVPRPSRQLARRWSPLVLGGVIAASLVLSRVGGRDRINASHAIFAHSIVAQKLQPLLLRISPVFHETAPVDLGRTRLAQRNPPAVAPLVPGTYARHNVLLVTFDAFRADLLDKFHAGHPITPHLNALASSSVTFRRAIANYSHTSRSLLSILAGSWRVRFPSEANPSRDAADIRERTRMPRVLRGAGYETAAIMMAGRWGEVFFDRERFPEFDQHVGAGERCDDQVLKFREYMAGRDEKRPFFAWLHFFDTHTPYKTDNSDHLFGASVRGLYYAAAHHTDRCLGEVLSDLESRGEQDRTLVVVTADHGEALGEHDRVLQHSTCYLHDIHIPLVIRLPDRRTRLDAAFPIQPSDLLPTVANLLGVAMDNERLDGDDLSGLFRGEQVPGADAMAFSQGHPEQYACASVLADRWHLIYTHASRGYELYDVAVDPEEQQNLAAERPDILERLQPVLDSFRRIAVEGPSHPLP